MSERFCLVRLVFHFAAVMAVRMNSENFHSCTVLELWRGELYVATAASSADRGTRLLLQGVVGGSLIGVVGLNFGLA